MPATDSTTKISASPRRNSTTMKYASLHQHKRSNDETNARRLSVHDQYAAPGFLGGLWHNFTKGKPSK